MPDSITAFSVKGKTYLATANEGGDRADWEDGTDFADNDVTKAKKLVKDFGLTLDSSLTDASGDLLADLENIRVTPHDCLDTDGDGDIDVLVGFGGRSFSLWDEDLNLVYDSGSLFERFTADYQPDFFNCSNDNLAIDDRSPKKGPEPEAIAFGEIEGIPLLFVGLERFGGFFVFDVSDPTAPEMMLYYTDRNFSAALNEDREYEDTSFNNTGDLGPEGFHFVSADDSLTGKALLITGSEVSGTVSVYQMEF